MRHVGFYSLSLLLAACLQANAQKISFKEGNISLKQAFQKIEDVSKYKIAYNETQLDMNKTVRLDQTNKDVLDILSEILSGTGYIYSVKDNYIIITSDQQQKKQKTKKITGLVIDENGEPVIGANVIEKGTTNGTVTDIDGRYSLSVPESSVLTVSYIGYADKEVRVGTGTIIDVSLLEDTQALDEVVVVGYGTMKKSDLTGSVVNVNQEQLRNLPTTSID